MQRKLQRNAYFVADIVHHPTCENAITKDFENLRITYALANCAKAAIEFPHRFLLASKEDFSASGGYSEEHTFIDAHYIVASKLALIYPGRYQIALEASACSRIDSKPMITDLALATKIQICCEPSNHTSTTEWDELTAEPKKDSPFSVSEYSSDQQNNTAIVTVVTEKTMPDLRNLIGSFHTYFPSLTVIAYYYNLTKPRISEISVMQNVTPVELTERLSQLRIRVTLNRMINGDSFSQGLFALKTALEHFSKVM